MSRFLWFTVYMYRCTAAVGLSLMAYSILESGQQRAALYGSASTIT